MTLSIQLDDRTATALKAMADARGISIDVYLKELAEKSAMEAASTSEDPAVSTREFDKAMDELFAADGRALPDTRSTYSRSDIYFDHE